MWSLSRQRKGCASHIPGCSRRRCAASECAPEEAVFVGDSPYHDIGGAKAVGMAAVHTTQYVTRPGVPGTPPPDATIAHLREVSPLIKRWAKAG